jgi:hypothetical protein
MKCANAVAVFDLAQTECQPFLDRARRGLVLFIICISTTEGWRSSSSSVRCFLAESVPFFSMGPE